MRVPVRKEHRHALKCRWPCIARHAAPQFRLWMGNCAARVVGGVYFASSVLPFSSSDSIMYRHSSPRDGRSPLIRINAECTGDSGQSISINSSPVTNLSRRRDAINFASNACVTLRFMITRDSSNSRVWGRPSPGKAYISASAATPLSTAAARSLRRIALTMHFTCGMARAALS